MPKVPVPNQPTFVIGYNPFTINIHGSVTNNKHKVGTMYVHGNIIQGTQILLGIPIRWTGFSQKGRIFVHGYFLTAYTPFASTRFRIPLIVSIWKMYLGHCNVVATMTETQQDTTVYACCSTETEYIKPTWVLIDSGKEADESMYGHFGVYEISHTRHLLAPVAFIAEIIHKLIARTRDKWSNLHYTIKAQPSVPNKQGISKIRARVMTGVNEFKFGLTVGILNPLYEKYKLTARIVSPVINNTYSFIVDLVNSTLSNTYKMSVHLINPAFNLAYKMKVMLHDKFERKIKLSTHTVKQMLEAAPKFKVRPEKPLIESLHRLKVSVKPRSINRLLGFIEWLISGSKIEQTSKIDFKSQKSEKDTRVKMGTIAVLRGQLRTWLQAQTVKVNKMLSMNTSEGIERKSVMKIHSSESISSYNSFVAMCVKSMENEKKLLFNYTTHEEDVDLTIDTLPLLEDRTISFRPTNVPQMRWLNVLVTVLKTETLAYINYIIDEAVKEPEVRVSMHKQEVISLLQWYVHGGFVSNDGTGNEVIFDLGEADDGSGPGGTIPPIPSRQWFGGYVEDTFKGVGYKPVENSTGYVSPGVDSWLSGSKMYWSKPTEPFQEG